MPAPTLREYLGQIDERMQAFGLDPMTPQELQQASQDYQRRVQQGVPLNHPTGGGQTPQVGQIARVR